MEEFLRFITDGLTTCCSCNLVQISTWTEALPEIVPRLSWISSLNRAFSMPPLGFLTCSFELNLLFQLLVRSPTRFVLEHFAVLWERSFTVINYFVLFRRICLGYQSNLYWGLSSRYVSCWSFTTARFLVSAKPAVNRLFVFSCFRCLG